MRFGLVLALFLMIPALSAQESNPPLPPPISEPYVEHEIKEFKFYPGGKIGISLEVPGNLKIVGWEKSSVRLEAEKIVYYLTTENAQAFLKTPPIRVRYTDTTSTIKASGAPAAPGILEINLVVYVPKGKTDLTLGVRQGDVSVENLNGWVEANIAEGNLEVASLAGYFSGRIQRGDIHADMSGRQWRGQEFSAITQEGGIELLLPEKYSAALQLNTRNGKITVDYPPQEVEGELTPPEIIKQNNAQLLKASIGDGGAPIKLSSSSGDISVSLKK